MMLLPLVRSTTTRNCPFVEIAPARTCGPTVVSGMAVIRTRGTSKHLNCVSTGTVKLDRRWLPPLWSIVQRMYGLPAGHENIVADVISSGIACESQSQSPTSVEVQHTCWFLVELQSAYQIGCTFCTLAVRPHSTRQQYKRFVFVSAKAREPCKESDRFDENPTVLSAPRFPGQCSWRHSF